MFEISLTFCCLSKRDHSLHSLNLENTFSLSRFKVSANLVAQMEKNLPVMWETWVQSLGPEALLEKEMATHSSILAWRIPWREESGGLQLTGSQRVGHDWGSSLHYCFHFHTWAVFSYSKNLFLTTLYKEELCLIKIIYTYVLYYQIILESV